MIAKRIARGGRRYGRIEGDNQGDLVTHRITIGWDIRPQGAERPKPGRLPGFLITRDTLGPDGRWVIDWPAMRLLGDYTPEKFAAVWKHQDTLAAPLDLLPQTLRFVLMNDALVVPGGFAYPGTIAEEYQVWNGQGRFCHGDGETASRKRGDGGVDRIQCNPIGKIDCTEFCPFSLRGECKSRSRLLLCLYTLDPEGQRLLLAPTLGETARYRLETSSEYNAIGILEVLDRVAERLYAPDLWPSTVWMKYLTGVLTFSIRKRQSPKGGKVKVQQIGFSIDESAIVAREQEIQGERERRLARQLEYHRAGFSPKQLAGPAMRLPAPEPCQVTPPTPHAAATAPTCADGRRESEGPWDDPPPQRDQPAEELDGVENAASAPYPEPEPEPAAHPADTEDPVRLIAALDGYVEAVGQRELVDDAVVWRRIASFTVSGRQYHATGPDWFLQHEKGDPNKHAFRIRLLRDICRELWDDERFEIMTLAGEAQAQAEDEPADAEVAS